jgi:hypothetical protein
VLPQAKRAPHTADTKNILVKAEIEGIFSPLLFMARYTAFVICSAMAAVAAGRVEFAFDLVRGHEVATMRHFTVGTVAVFCRRLHFNLIGVAVITEGAFMTGGTETVV